jgi:hypothetical protein
MFIALWFRLSFTHDPELLELASSLLHEWRAHASA